MKKITISITLALLWAMGTMVHGQQSLQQISIKANSFVNQSGEVVIFKGVNFSDPDKLEKEGQWKKELFREARDWGSNIVRLPVHPRAWRSRGPNEYLKLLDQGVAWAKEYGLYVIIDWHSIGNLRTELYQNEMYITTKKETFEFWYTISRKYANEPAVALYEIFNEPTTFNNQLGSLTWDQWTEIMTDIITVIRANNPKAIPLVAGFNWAYDLTPVAYAPLNIPQVAYVSHPYPQKRDQPWAPQWERDFGFVSDNYPVITTEIGFMQSTDRGAHIPCIGDETYGQELMDYFNKKGISWVAWCFDPDWSPQLISDWNYTPTRAGAFFKKAMLEE